MSQPSDPSPSSSPSLDANATATVSLSAKQLQQVIAALAPTVQHATASSPALFVGPPLMNPATGASLEDSFPEVEAGILASITNHSLQASDLYKLDARYHDKPDRSALELEGTTLRIKGDVTVKDYLTSTFILQPLAIYFSVLLQVVPHDKAFLVGIVSMQYMAQLFKLVEEYEWPAILRYHLAFHQGHCREMICGNYSRWATCDTDLIDEHLTGHQKLKHAAGNRVSTNGTSQHKKPAAGEVCHLYNIGVCTTTPCKNS
ncbi:hypothetical protein FRB96_008374 [Tulasnella sp. 330]|nr:hypothetical protein FRB96_008374 [Tulasnella sp. 330]KAG8867937.1 hypothetical protein FRB97_002877 [Tulasnella sp. 331]KAG8868738.1 hypothetical protein FRB98_003279 [Tulasnella sp. 332]